MAPQVLRGDTKVLFGVLLWGGYARPSSRARATASVRRWTWSLPKIFRLWPFHRVQGEEEPLADLVIRESLSNEAQDFQFALAQWLDQRLGPTRAELRGLLSVKDRQQPPDVVRHAAVEQRPRTAARPSARLRRQSCGRIRPARPAPARHSSSCTASS